MLEPQDFVGYRPSSESEAEADPHFTKNIVTNPSAYQKLRRLSRSEPHLDIPHFINNNSSSLIRDMSGFFEVGAALSTPLSNYKQHIRTGDFPVNRLDDQKSATNPERNMDRHLSPHLSSGNESHKLPSHNFNPTNTLHTAMSAAVLQYNSGGCAEAIDSPEMTKLSTRNRSADIILGANEKRSEDSLVRGSELTNHTPVPPASTVKKVVNSSFLSDRDTRLSADERHNGVLGVLGRGFFGKPVLRSEEEKYRYMMTLD
ncbi:hypothetical protein AB6A40_001329 [Gnathostoma spinigerum]|uniref:Uncharacterized protein n=1 Tax=Gnathostoma spinigerum TaxID=75299 RepID=A0ABD6E4X6_9BILA